MDNEELLNQMRGARINEVIEELGITQKEMADSLGYTTVHMNNLIKGRKRVLEEHARRIAEVYNNCAEAAYQAREIGVETLEDEDKVWIKNGHMVLYSHFFSPEGTDFKLIRWEWIYCIDNKKYQDSSKDRLANMFVNWSEMQKILGVEHLLRKAIEKKGFSVLEEDDSFHLLWMIRKEDGTLIKLTKRQREKMQKELERYTGYIIDCFVENMERYQRGLERATEDASQSQSKLAKITVKEIAKKLEEEI